jgi:hypothetical protein
MQEFECKETAMLTISGLLSHYSKENNTFFISVLQNIHGSNDPLPLTICAAFDSSNPAASHNWPRVDTTVMFTAQMISFAKHIVTVITNDPVTFQNREGL